MILICFGRMMYLREVVEQHSAQKSKDKICSENKRACEVIEAIICLIARSKIEDDDSIENCLFIDKDQHGKYYLYQIENINIVYKVPIDESLSKPQIYIEDIQLKMD